jgi:hypothetical protein
VSEPERPQVSWKAIEANAKVLARGGEEAGQVSRVVGDQTADVFTGLALSGGVLSGERFLAAERVTAIWPDAVQTDLDAAGLDGLPPFDETPTVRWDPGKRSFLDRLFGRRPN